MNEISSYSNLPPALPPDIEQTLLDRPPRRQSARTAEVSADRVELSETAASYDAQNATALEQRVQGIRAEIAADTYVTPDKLEVAIDGLLRDVLGAQR